MDLKKLYLSTAILSLGAIATYFLKSADSNPPEDPRVGSSLIANESLEGVNHIALESGSETLTFQLDAGIGSWVLNEQHSLPADTNKINQLITQLKDAKLERVASKNPERIASFGFGLDRIQLLDTQSEPVLSLELGREADNGKQLVKYAGEDIAFLASSSFAVDGEPLSWLDKTLLEFERDDIRFAKFDLSNGESITVTRPNSETDWTAESPLPEGRELDQGAITRAVNRFAKVSLTGLAAKDADDVIAAAENAVKIELKLEDGSHFQISVGRRSELRVEKEVESVNEDGETVTTLEEQVEQPAGPTYISIASGDTDAPINQYMERVAFEVGAFIFTNMPESLEGLSKELPPEEPAGVEPPPPAEAE